jgi:hypothetical protein
LRLIIEVAFLYVWIINKDFWEESYIAKQLQIKIWVTMSSVGFCVLTSYIFCMWFIS